MRIGIYLLAALSGFFFFTSCSKEESVETGRDKPAIVNGVLRMKINGTQWIADYAANAIVIGDFIQINGFSKDKKSININLLDTAARIYVLNQAGSDGGAVYTDSLDSQGNSYSTVDGLDSSNAGGIVNITSIDRVNKTISGTFQCKVYRNSDSKQKQITEGVFDKLSYSITIPPASITDTFRVMIDNTNWIAKSISSSASQGSLAITASESDLSKVVGLSMPQNITAGIYDLDFFSTYKGFYILTGTTYFTSESGKLTIIEHDPSTKRIRGTFNFKATAVSGTKSFQFTQGYFSLNYQ